MSTPDTAEAEVIVLRPSPGTAFGSSGEGWVRVSLAGERADVLEGLSRFPAVPA